MRYTVDRTFEFERDTLAAAEKFARQLALEGKWVLLSVSRADDPKPLPGPGTWKVPTFELKV
jgi:hypothetical protein